MPPQVVPPARGGGPEPAVTVTGINTSCYDSLFWKRAGREGVYEWSIKIMTGMGRGNRVWLLVVSARELVSKEDHVWRFQTWR